MVTNPTLRFLLCALLAPIFLNVAHADDWVRVSSKDKKVSAMFPEDIRKSKQTQVTRTIAGRVTTYFGEHHGDGILLAGSGADLPRLARSRHKTVFETTKKGFLEEAKGTETGFKTTTVGGVPARELTFQGKAYRGKGGPYTGRALFFIVNDRIYIVNSVISKANATNKAANHDGPWRQEASPEQSEAVLDQWR